MLSIFPTLLDYQLLAPFILRVVLGAILILFARESLRGNFERFGRSTTVNWLEALAGVLLLIGLFTQVAAIATIVFVLIRWKMRKSAMLIGKYESFLYLTLFVTAISLLFLGAGFLAFDLPL